jgi:hypothetical protein
MNHPTTTNPLRKTREVIIVLGARQLGFGQQEVWSLVAAKYTLAAPEGASRVTNLNMMVGNELTAWSTLVFSAVMFSLLARYRPRATLDSTIRSLSDSSPASRSIYFTIKVPFDQWHSRPRPRHSEVKAALSAYGTVTRLHQMIPNKPWSYIATFQDEAAAKKFLEAEKPPRWKKAQWATKLPVALPVMQRPSDETRSSSIILKRVPVQCGCTTEDVAALVKTFGRASIRHPSSWKGNPLNSVIIEMKDQAAADAMVDASFTGEGLSINGDRVYACYITLEEPRLFQYERGRDNVPWFSATLEV